MSNLLPQDEQARKLAAEGDELTAAFKSAMSTSTLNIVGGVVVPFKKVTQPAKPKQPNTPAPAQQPLRPAAQKIESAIDTKAIQTTDYGLMLLKAMRRGR